MSKVTRNGNGLQISKITLPEYDSNRYFYVIASEAGEMFWAVGTWPDGSQRREIVPGTKQWELLRVEVAKILEGRA
jgi:hypothetical protein